MSRDKNMFKYPLRIILTVLAVSIPVMIVVFMLWLKYYGLAIREIPDLAEISQKTSLSFPRTTHLLHSKSIGFQGYELFAVLEMPGSDAESFLKTLNNRAMKSDTDRFEISNKLDSDRDRWWNPDSVTQATSYKVKFPVVDFRYPELRVLICNSQSERMVVYIYYRE